MRVISPKLYRAFCAIHSDARNPLNAWKKSAERAKWAAWPDVKAEFGARVDRYERFVIFDIGGNKFRLIVVIHYNRGIVYLRHVLTHAEYDRGKWKDD